MNDMGLKVEEILKHTCDNCGVACPESRKAQADAILTLFKEMVPEENTEECSNFLVTHYGKKLGWNEARESMLSRIEEMGK